MLAWCRQPPTALIVSIAMSEPESPQRLPLRAYRDLLGRYLRPQSGRVALMAALLLTGIALRLVNPRIIGYFLDAAQSGGARGPLLIAGVLFVTFALLQLAMSLAAGYVAQSVGWAATLRLRADLALHVLRLDMPFHAAHTPGELIDRIDGDAGTLAHFLSAFSIDIAGNGLLVAGIIVMLALTSPWAGLGMLVYALATLLVLNRIQNLAAPRWTAQRAAQSRLYGYLEERIGGAEELQAAGAQPHALRQLHLLLRPFVATTRAGLVYSGLAHNLTQLVYVLGYAAGLAIGVLLYLRGQATLGTAYLITYYVGMLSEPLQAIRAELQDLQQAAASIRRIRALLAERPAVEGGTRPLPAGPLGVALEGVSFAYRPAPAPASDDNPDAAAVAAEAIQALSGVTLEVAPGRVLGVLGRTGSGKSTLTRLLIRLYTPDEGTILLGDPNRGCIDLREVPLANLRGWAWSRRTCSSFRPACATT
ncbi:MAG: ABC transporter ATP-binding protein [Anaerolineae bacterium]